jgi:NADH-quinone oxidoreductase subunit L
MTARSWAIYTHAPAAMNAIAIVGLATAFFAATIGLAQNDIKKVFAYSTVSQLGYIFLGVGCGAFSAGIYHLVTHAFFKALLFLGAGSVIHALSGEQDMSRMGGLRKKIPCTFWTMVCAAAAIAGVPPFAGFYSKDAILIAAYQQAPWIYWVGVITAGMTAFYVFRAMFLTFFGEYRGDRHPHESPPVMLVPLVVLALLSLGGGYFLRVPEFLRGVFHAGRSVEDPVLMAISVAAGVAGIALAALMYWFKPGMADAFAGRVSGLYKLVYNKYFVDEIYDAALVRPLVGGSREVLWKAMDTAMIDGAVNGAGAAAREVGGVVQRIQSGNIRSYATWVVFGAVMLIFVMGLAGGLIR